MLHLATSKTGPSVADVRRRFPDLSAVTIPMLRRSFDIKAHTARQLLRLARQAKEAECRAPDPRIRELMERFRFSESEARWALDNVGMPE